MFVKLSRLASMVVLFGLCVWCPASSTSQEQPPVPVEPRVAPGNVPNGVEVLARGPIHEAFASPLTEPKATQPIPKRPPLPIEELPPDERPEGDVVWVGGYWGWDDDRADFLWVSGCWRIKPANKEWVPGYWREVGANWQWVPGFWTSVQEGRADSVTYFPEPPAPPNIAPVGEAPAADTFHIPGYWMWNGDRYIWRAGYWTRVRPGYVYVPSHYRWTPSGYVFIGGYWDLAVSRRGVLYAPIIVNVGLVGPRYVYTPYYAVRDTIVLDTMFVRPIHAHYYFGDYYGPRYAAIGFEPCIVYSRRHYEPIMVYQRWHYRDNPRWHDTQVTLVIERNAGRAPVPPRTLVQQNTIVRNNVTNVTNITNVTNVIAPTKTVVVARGEKVVPIDPTTRSRLHQATQSTQQSLAVDRRKSETAGPGSVPLTKPRVAAMNLTPGQPMHTRPLGTGNPPFTGGKTPAGTIPQPMGPGTTPRPNPFNDPKTPTLTKPGPFDPHPGSPFTKQNPVDAGKGTPPMPPFIGSNPPRDGKGRPPIPPKKSEETKKKGPG